MGLGWLRLVLSLMVMDTHFEGFRYYLQPLLVEHFGVDRLSFVGEGGIAVTGFFVISGYVIAYVLGCKYDTSHWWGVGLFYLGRALRIYPLYLLVFTTYWAVLSGLGHPPALPPQGVVDNLLLLPYGLRNLFADFNAFGALQLSQQLLIGPAWTLTLDLLLYLLAPFLFIRKSVAWGVWWLGLGYYLCFAGYGDARPPLWFAYFYATAPPYIFAFASGALVFHYRERAAPGAGWAAIAVVVLLLLTYCPLGFTNTILNQLFATVAFAVLVAQLSKQRASQRWDRLFGDLTYATYLIHAPLLNILHIQGVPYAVPVTLAATYGLGVLLLYGFEYPLDRLRDRIYQRGRVALRPGMISVGLTWTLPGLALAVYCISCLWGVVVNLVGARAASQLRLDSCTPAWRCEVTPHGAMLQLTGVGQGLLSFLPPLPPAGRIVLDLSNQGEQGEVFAGFGVRADGQETLQVGLLRQDNQCHLLIAEPGRDTRRDPWGWSPDCRLRHRFLVDTSTGTVILAVDSLWVYPTAGRGDIRLRVIANEPGQGKVTLQDLFVGGR